MEVIAGIASFIAIGQALAATPKIIEVLISLANSKQEVLILLNELEVLNSLGIRMREIVQHSPAHDPASTLQRSQLLLLDNIETDLSSVISELRKIANKFQRAGDQNDEGKASRLKWLRYRPKIASLSARTRKSRERLQSIMSHIYLSTIMSYGKMIVEVHTVVTTHAPPTRTRQALLQFPGQVIQSNENITSNMASNKALNPSIDAGTNSTDIAILSDEFQELGLPGNANGNNTNQPQTHEPLLQVTAAIRRGCTRDCTCQCHSRRSQHQSSAASSPIYGWLMSAYNCAVWSGTRGCDIRTCRRAHDPTYINLRFPLWFCSSALEAKIALGSLTGPGSSFHLHVSRLIPFDDAIWNDVEKGKIERVRRALVEREIFPFDIDIGGYDVLQYSVVCYQLEIISMLLEEWQQAAIDARQRLHFFRHPDRDIAILQKVAALDEEYADESWPIHEAAQGRGDLLAALKKCPETIDALDDLGRSPLHWAASNGNISAIHTLISHGANMNVRDYRNETPLMNAAWEGNFYCVQILIKSDCDINRSDKEGATALHRAIGSPVRGSAKVVSLLLKHGPQLTISLYAINLLHSLACYPDAEDVGEKMQLLRKAGEDRETKDFDGRMLLNNSARNNNVCMTRLLFDAGCKFDDSPNWRNSLHDAALFANAEIIDLIEQSEFTVDVRVRDEGGGTPLDTFMWRMEEHPAMLPGEVTKPEHADIEAFRRLLRGARDRYLRAEIETLETVIQHLKTHACTDAREALRPIIQEKLHWNIPTELRTFRAIDVQIKEEMIEAAIESLEEFIEVSRTRLGTDPFVGDYCYSYTLEIDEFLV
ncbi:ankyrin [Whalleya microplaca]|nr:ankyrin [Whalleya microplaca]